MAILKMKKLHLFGITDEQEQLIHRLQLMGRVQIGEVEDVSSPDGAALFSRCDDKRADKYRQAAVKFDSALSITKKYDQAKAGMFAPRQKKTVRELFNDNVFSNAEKMAENIHKAYDALLRTQAEKSRLKAVRESFLPWSQLDIPLEMEGTRTTAVILGTIPAKIEPDEFIRRVYTVADETQIFTVHSDTRQHYMLILAHRDVLEDIAPVLKESGFVKTIFDGVTGTAAQNIRKCDENLAAAEKEEKRLVAELEELAKHRSELRLAYDRCIQESVKGEAWEKLSASKHLFMLAGWLPEEDVESFEKMAGDFCCAWELSDPETDEYPDVPIKLKNNFLTRPLNMVTEMYSLPAYDGVDPNPLMAPFFILFYGIMMADMGYGILMMLGSLFMIKVMHAKDGMKNFAGLLGLCGVSTFFVGAITGGFFGDFIPQIAKMINPESTLELPALFTPLNDTIAILVGAVALGVIQIITGMAINVVQKIKAGNFLDALFDEITWWIILAGVAMAVLDVGIVAGVPVVILTGVLMLALGGTRKARGFGKITSFIGLIYNGISGFFSDSLSYARLMALMLAGSVIAQVFNTLGSVIGNIPVFIIISLLGNVLNLALNLLGCYVHDLRLQCLEFFNRFYKDGGKPFKPFRINTKYIDAIKEEN